MAPSHANLFMGKFEQQSIDNSLPSQAVHLVEVHRLYLHDLDTWKEHLKSFIGFLNSIHPSIKFTHEYLNSLHQTLPFLDVQVYLIKNQIETDLHTKPLKRKQTWKSLNRQNGFRTTQLPQRLQNNTSADYGKLLLYKSFTTS